MERGEGKEAEGILKSPRFLGGKYGTDRREWGGKRGRGGAMGRNSAEKGEVGGTGSFFKCGESLNPQPALIWAQVDGRGGGRTSSKGGGAACSNIPISQQHNLGKNIMLIVNSDGQ